jgi:hypothetical protein
MIRKISEWLTILTNVGVILGLMFVGLEYQNNSSLLEIERATARDDQVNSIIDTVIQDPSLLELMSKDRDSLSQLESDRLRLLGLRMLLALDSNYVTSSPLDPPTEKSMISTFRAIYSRPRLNYGIPYAWGTYKERGETTFTQFFQKNIVEYVEAQAP